MSRRLIAVVGPSGAGKDTLMRRAAVARADVTLIRRAITRPADAGSEDFIPVTKAEFVRMAKSGEFALDWQAHGLCYGIPRQPPQTDGIGLVNLSRGVLEQAARAFPSLSVIHLNAKPEVLAKRLAARGRETPMDISQRIAREAPLLTGGLRVTFIDNSGDLETATADFLAALDEMVAS